MEKETWTLTLADGTSIEGLEMNGNNFVSESELDESIFDGNCSKITCKSSTGEEKTIENAELQQQKQYRDVPGYWLSFKTKTEEEIKYENLQSQIDYLSMMADVTMEESDDTL